ncbi:MULTISPECIES: DUF1329 domain-containing protein [unclassified Pseudomonas]|uniref:DUF1329 domain-containing protein n=1 Tax=unclassified Pseudomonas TaxID=196821 RepID=UPI0002A3A7DF|nr:MULTISPECIES: DUF1329 domain-containing protein [unclassified Pseudomonas]MBB1606072.1 hypothetical protein [Pseudomonas sp. UMC76]MBB1636545.1 hypothetical protein [Pseudomonas sp. UME83]NTX92713.1 DUF1329 domain-containing protein [Pseudomonas sp. UMA643]NTY19927.1 DUF1329 domain-containing protein [Pseudomonas sp. UMC3103]NTY27336.1 DUF1329 domain-containing protein [Pseudomonas sp. UMA603]
MNKLLAMGLLACAIAAPAHSAVTDEQAQHLKSDLTPFGAQKAGNADGSIPAWTGGLTTPTAGDVPGGRRGDPFKDEKPLFSISAKDMDKYAGNLSDGTKALLKKYPEFRLDVYPTHRTAAAPQWVYDNTFANATRAKMVDGVPTGAYGGIPFPIPQSAEEVVWNHVLRWRGMRFQHFNDWYQILADGRAVMVTDGEINEQLPYYDQNGNAEQFAKDNKPFWQVAIRNIGPPLRAGEALLAHEYLDQNKTQTWVYLKGQRRVRKLPNACCDTPTPAAAGVMTFDEMYTWTGRLDRFDWKLIGKQEMFIPYNANRLLQPTRDEQVLAGHTLNPDHVRWEKHRVWVVEANLRAGQRHQAPKSRYYCDEDTWICTLADRWDANGQLWRTLWSMPIVLPELPGMAIATFGYNDLLAGTAFVAQLHNTKDKQYVLKQGGNDLVFSPDGLAGNSVR